MMKISTMKSKNNATYDKKSFVMTKMKKPNLNYTKKLEIIVIIQENLEELLIAFVIKIITYQKFIMVQNMINTF